MEIDILQKIKINAWRYHWNVCYDHVCMNTQSMYIMLYTKNYESLSFNYQPGLKYSELSYG